MAVATLTAGFADEICVAADHAQDVFRLGTFRHQDARAWQNGNRVTAIGAAGDALELTKRGAGDGIRVFLPLGKVVHDGAGNRLAGSRFGDFAANDQGVRQGHVDMLTDQRLGRIEPL